MLKAIISEDSIQVLDNISDWPSAVRQASQPLLKTGAITTTYVDNMIQSVKDNGPYMVLTDYFALMHARPGVGVNRAAMSLLVTKQPVDLAGKPVKVFLVMAATDNTSHLQRLQSVMSVFMDQTAFETILSGDKSKIITLFN